MAIDQVPQEKIPDHQLFNPPKSALQVTDALNPGSHAYQIEKCLKQTG
jgi:hypothetical protein